MPLFAVSVPDLTAALAALVRQIPAGRVATYGDLATALGDHRAAVWVAKALQEPAFQSVAHRVVRVTGEPSRPSPDALDRLSAEGVPIEGRRVLLDDVRYRDFITERPLETLKQEQERVAAAFRPTKLRTAPRRVAGLDVSYRPDGVAVAAYVLMEAGGDEPCWTETIAMPSVFPYVPGFLAYRELPLYAELLRRVIEADRLADLLLVDGTGRLHPRRTGIATQLGVHLDHPTVGVSKRRLCGTVVLDDSYGPGSGRVVYEGEIVAGLLPSTGRAVRPIYVSSGNRCTLNDAVAVAMSWRKGAKLPEPIRRADALSRSIAKGGLEAT